MLIAFSVAPSGTGDSVADAVADAVRIVRESGLPHRTDSMFTTIEGEWDECMDVVRRACEAVGRDGHRVSLVLKADIRPGRSGELQGKLDRLEAAIARGAGSDGGAAGSTGQASGSTPETPDGTADGVPDGATDEGIASPS
jgi:uncharacterized protein (TIGR00106 family)